MGVDELKTTLLIRDWRDAFMKEIQGHETALRLKEAALEERLTDWTTALTAVAVATCKQMGWRASAKSHKLDLLPVQRSEYLALDVMAFRDAKKRWRFLLR